MAQSAVSAQLSSPPRFLSSRQTIPDLPSINSRLFDAKARKGVPALLSSRISDRFDNIQPGLTFDEIAKAIGKDEVWVAAAFYGQVRLSVCFSPQSKESNCIQAKFTPDELKQVSELLELSTELLEGGLGEHWWPNRGLGPIPPTDPVIYRLYEVRICDTIVGADGTDD